MSDEVTENEETVQSSILDAVSHTRQEHTLRSFNPQRVVFDVLENLSKRERDILTNRYGLIDGQTETLEKIGTRYELTRERVRQIEKESVKKLRKVKFTPELTETINLIHQILEEAGEITTQQNVVDTLTQSPNPTAEQAVLFILSLAPEFGELKESKKYNVGWYLAGFDQKELDRVVEEAAVALDSADQVLTLEKLHKKLDELDLSAEVLENYLRVSKKIDQNKYGEWGIADWPEVRPKDVGDKAYLVLAHHGKPEHYEEITKLINKQKFDDKTAHKETVHNELIKDQRFVLVGRGIYALKEWGYKRGTVADVIERVLMEAGEPVERNELIDRVLEQRMVKRNTVAVGLSNKDKFKKIPDGRYALADNGHNLTQNV